MNAYKLTQEQISELRRHQREMHDILPVFDDAEACGIDCTDFRAVREEVFNNLENLIKRFGPQSK